MSYILKHLYFQLSLSSRIPNILSSIIFSAISLSNSAFLVGSEASVFVVVLPSLFDVVGIEITFDVVGIESTGITILSFSKM